MSRLACVLIIALTAMGYADEVERPPGYFGATHWGMTDRQTSEFLLSLTGDSAEDSIGVMRYSDSIYGHSCEIIPGSVNDSLDLVLIRFHVAHDAFTEAETSFADIQRVLQETYGTPQFLTGFYGAIPDLFGKTCQLCTWAMTRSRVTLLLERDPTDLSPRVDLMFSSLSSGDLSRDQLEGEELLKYAHSEIDRVRRILTPPLLFGKEKLSPDDCGEDFDGIRERNPEIVHRAHPEYPAAARRDYVQGVVWIQALLDQEGTVRDVRIAQRSGTDYGLEEAAVKAAYENRYKPAIICDEPRPVWVAYPVEFKIR